MNDLLTRLGMEHISDYFDECYEKALSDIESPAWLSEKYIREGAEEYPYFSSELERVIDALDEVKNSPDLVLFAKTLYIMLGDRRYHEELFEGLEFPKAPEGENPLPYDIFSFYPMFARIREAMATIRTMGVDEEIIRATYTGIDGCIVASTRLEGRFAFNKTYFLWCTLYKNAVLFKVDRFSFELREGCKLNIYGFINADGEIKILMKEGVKVHRSGLLLGSASAKDESGHFVTNFEEKSDAFEGYLVDESTATVGGKVSLDKKEWKLLYKPGDDIISVHIPGKKPFDKETVDRSIDKGRDFFKKLYPDKDIKAFMCISWLLEPALKKILKPTSNIIYFQDLYTKFPYVSLGLDVFHFVFEKSVTSLSDIDLDTLSENTSLERNLKQIYKSGGYIYETGGIFKF